MTVCLVVLDITANDYLDVYQDFVDSIKSRSNDITRIDVLSLKQINDAEQLNIALSSTYSSLRHKFTEAGWSYRLDITVVFNSEPSKLLSDTKKVFISKGVSSKLSLECEIQYLSSEPKPISKNSSERSTKKFRVAALGGTFDHIHDGHKILISVAAFLAQRKLIIGITGQALLKNKKYAECLEAFPERMNRTLLFLQRVLDPSVRFDVYEINDVCGPTGFVPDIDCLIVSEESSKGGVFVNDYRKKQGYSSLEIFTIKVVGEEGSNEKNSWKGKMSSTDIRQKIYEDAHKTL